jgi:hypothetical protein
VKWVCSKRSMSMKRMGTERITSTLLKSNVVRVACGSQSYALLFYNPLPRFAQREDPAFFVAPGAVSFRKPAKKRPCTGD